LSFAPFFLARITNPATGTPASIRNSASAISNAARRAFLFRHTYWAICDEAIDRWIDALDLCAAEKRLLVVLGVQAGTSARQPSTSSASHRAARGSITSRIERRCSLGGHRTFAIAQSAEMPMAEWCGRNGIRKCLPDFTFAHRVRREWPLPTAVSFADGLNTTDFVCADPT
jgi:hypothetical protein